MRALLSALTVSLAMLMAWQGLGRAAVDAAPAREPLLEVLVFEHADCVYCRVFRRDVLPRYRDEVKADAAPLRFVDVGARADESVDLKARIDTVPTVVVVRNGREVDRIVGYWGPANFFRLLSRILATIE
jgi:thioredoxin-related protein